MPWPVSILFFLQILQAGAHVDDRDGLTDMTMLHYAVKAGTRGMGDAEESCRMIRLLLSRGADPYIRCRWTNMAAIHYAIYFDVAPVVTVLLDATKAVGEVLYVWVNIQMFINK